MLRARSRTGSSSVLDKSAVKRSTGYEVEALGMESRPSSIIKPESRYNIFFIMIWLGSESELCQRSAALQVSGLGSWQEKGSR